MKVRTSSLRSLRMATAFSLLLGLFLPSLQAERIVCLTLKNEGKWIGDFSREDLADHPQATTLTTATPWTEENIIYEGVPLADLLAEFDPKGKQLKLSARNGYVVLVNADEILHARPFLAVKADNRWMRTRDKGPVWMIFPFSDHPEFDNGTVRRAAVWMLAEIDLVTP